MTSDRDKRAVEDLLASLIGTVEADDGVEEVEAWDGDPDAAPRLYDGTRLLEQLERDIAELRQLSVGVESTTLMGQLPGPVTASLLKAYNTATRKIEYQFGLVCNILEAIVDDLYRAES